jgi:hypothetical protein
MYWILGRVVDDLVHRQQAEVDGHDLHDGASAGHRGADGGADEALLGDRRVAHAVLAVLVHQPGRDAVGAVEEAELLAEQVDAVVALELLVEREAQGLADAHGRHQDSPCGAPVAIRASWRSESGSP